AFRTVRVAHLTAQGHEISAADQLAGVVSGERQREALMLLASSPAGLDTPGLVRRGVSAATLKRLAGAGLVSFTRRQVDGDPFGYPPRAGRREAVALTSEQAAALEQLSAMTRARRFAAALLHGVTGSGKTEIYLRLAQEVAASGRGVVMLVPEIALPPAGFASFRALFGDRVAIQHSGLSDGERHDQWHRIRRGEVDVVVGTRSAIFAPLDRLGLIVVDEEHDSSYKQEETPRYHGRDVAIMRGSRERALVVLGSATPSMETGKNAATGKYGRGAPGGPGLDRPRASVRIVNMGEEYAADGPDVIVSRPLGEAIE